MIEMFMWDTVYLSFTVLTTNYLSKKEDNQEVEQCLA